MTALSLLLGLAAPATAQGGTVSSSLANGTDQSVGDLNLGARLVTSASAESEVTTDPLRRVIARRNSVRSRLDGFVRLWNEEVPVGQVSASGNVILDSGLRLRTRILIVRCGTQALVTDGSGGGSDVTTISFGDRTLVSVTAPLLKDFSVLGVTVTAEIVVGARTNWNLTWDLRPSLLAVGLRGFGATQNTGRFSVSAGVGCFAVGLEADLSVLGSRFEPDLFSNLAAKGGFVDWQLDAIRFALKLFANLCGFGGSTTVFEAAIPARSGRVNLQ